jgi:hypothetical protein
MITMPGNMNAGHSFIIPTSSEIDTHSDNTTVTIEYSSMSRRTIDRIRLLTPESACVALGVETKMCYFYLNILLGTNRIS